MTSCTIARTAASTSSQALSTCNVQQSRASAGMSRYSADIKQAYWPVVEQAEFSTSSRALSTCNVQRPRTGQKFNFLCKKMFLKKEPPRLWPPVHPRCLQPAEAVLPSMTKVEHQNNRLRLGAPAG